MPSTVPARKLPKLPRVDALTEKRIEALSPMPGRQYVCWDRTTKGFGVRVSPEGTKAFILKYRLPSGRVRWKTIGRVDTLTLTEARETAIVDRGLVASGQDPLTVKDTARSVSTVADVATRFLEDFVKPRRKASTLRLYTQCITDHITPRLGTVPITEIGHAEIVKLHDRLRATPFMANRVIATLSSLLSWSMEGGRYRPIGPNPAVGIEKFPEPKRRRYLDADEYARLGRALRAADLAPSPRTAIELLLLTGARPVEIATLQWAHVDFKGAALRLPDSKTGAKVIHLAPVAVKLLKAWPRHVSSQYVFPGTGRYRRGAHLHTSTLTHLWADLRTTAKLTNARLYDACRHSYASMAVSRHGLTLPQVAAQLGHAQPATTARYAHLHDAVAQQHAAMIGGSIAKALKKKPARR